MNSDQPGGTPHILGGMTAVVRKEDGIIHALRPELDSRDMIGFEQIEHLIVDTVGTGRNSDALEAIDTRHGRIEQ